MRRRRRSRFRRRSAEPTDPQSGRRPRFLSTSTTTMGAAAAAATTRTTGGRCAFLLLAVSSSLLVGTASALRLTSLLQPFRGDGGGGGSGTTNGGGGGGGGEDIGDDNDPLGPLAFPRRDLVSELGGEEAYRAKIEEALGGGRRMAGGGGGDVKRCEEGDPECPTSSAAANGGGTRHGVDVSFPVHRRVGSSPREKFYDSYLAGCREAFYSHSSSTSHTEDECGAHESSRLDANLHQPRTMRNYTDVGFLKTVAPEGLYGRLKEFWNVNRVEGRKVEKWPRGSTYVNHWKVPTYMVDLDDASLPGGGMDLRNAVWDGAREALSDWIGGEWSLSASSMYGIRVYEKGAVWAPHVDRLPLVTSAIIHVDDDADGGKPWPLEVIAHDGRAYNVTLNPGEMLLYEGHSVVHGRPYPLEGSFHADVFVHFEPRGHSQRHAERTEASAKDGKVALESDEELYRRALEKATYQQRAREERKNRPQWIAEIHEGGKKDPGKGDAGGDGLPDYIARDTPEAKRWQQDYVHVDPGTTVATVTLDEALGRRTSSSSTTNRNVNTSYGQNAAHRAASTGDIDTLRDIAASDDQKSLLFTQDRNGWQPLHEAARGGYYRIVELLLDEGADVNARTNQGRGGNALWWAEKTHGKNHPVSKLLKKRGGITMGPNSKVKK